MSSIIEELLAAMDDDLSIEQGLEKIPEARELLNLYQNYRKKYDFSLPKITEDSTSKEFKDALLKLPATTKLSFLNRYTDLLNQSIQDNSSACDEIQTKKDHKRLIRLIVYSFFGLALIIIGTVTYLSINGKEIPDGEIFSTITTMVVEVLKVIVGI